MDSVWKLLNWGHASLGRGRVDNAYSWSGIDKSLHQILWPMFLKHFLRWNKIHYKNLVCGGTPPLGWGGRVDV